MYRPVASVSAGKAVCALAAATQACASGRPLVSSTVPARDPVRGSAPTGAAELGAAAAAAAAGEAGAAHAAGTAALAVNPAGSSAAERRGNKNREHRTARDRTNNLPLNHYLADGNFARSRPGRPEPTVNRSPASDTASQAGPFCLPPEPTCSAARTTWASGASMAVGPPGIGMNHTCIIGGVTWWEDPAGQVAMLASMTPVTTPRLLVPRFLCT